MGRWVIIGSDNGVGIRPDTHSCVMIWPEDQGADNGIFTRAKRRYNSVQCLKPRANHDTRFEWPILIHVITQQTWKHSTINADFDKRFELPKFLFQLPWKIGGDLCRNLAISQGWRMIAERPDRETSQHERNQLYFTISGKHWYIFTQESYATVAEM